MVAINWAEPFRVHEIDDSRGGGELESGRYRSFSDLEARVGPPRNPESYVYAI